MDMMDETINAQNYYSSNEPLSDVFLKLMIDVEETLQKFKMEVLRREILSIDVKTRTKKWVSIAKNVGPVCNDLGISEIMGMVRGRVTTFGRLTKKTNNEIMSDMYQFHRTLIETFSLRADDWELDEELIKPIQEACLALVQDIIFSSRDGFTAINLRSQYSRSETSNISEHSPKKKIMGVEVG
jgi:hypothetical protein